MPSLSRKVCIVLVAGLIVSASDPVAAQCFLEKLQKSTGDLGKSFGLGSGSGNGGLSTADIASGLREALKVGTDRLTSRLGAVNGFNADPTVHIPLPESLQRVQSTLRRFGLSGMADDLETRLNRAAEAAVPKGRKLFRDAIQRMTLDDARGILNGPKDSATRYFEGKMTMPLKA